MKRLQKILAGGVLCVLMTLLFAARAYAAPADGAETELEQDAFFQAHRDEIAVIAPLSFTALTDTVAFDAPGGSREVSVTTGSNYYCFAVYVDEQDAYFGLFHLGSPEEGTFEWVDLSTVELLEEIGRPADQVLRGRMKELRDHPNPYGDFVYEPRQLTRRPALPVTALVLLGYTAVAGIVIALSAFRRHSYGEASDRS